MGLSDLIKWNQWTITSLDAVVSLNLEGQYDPDNGVETDAAPILSESSTVGSERPSVQWVAGGRRSVRFRSTYASYHQLDDITAKLTALDALDRRDASLGRAPRVSFQWGDLALEGFAKVQKRIDGWWPVSGWPRRVDFEIEIVEAYPLDVGAGSSSSSGETQFLTLGDGETFENLAAVHLGSPLKGDLIRRLNPAIAAGEQAGDRVKVLERNHPAMLEAVRPSSPPFLGLEPKASDPVYQVLEDLAESRGTTTPGLAWSRLPEVVAGEVG